MEITTYENAQDAIGTVFAVTWEELVGDLTTHELTPCAPCKGKSCRHKNGLAWVPGRVGKCPDVCRRAGTASNCGGNRQHRLMENVEHVHAAVFDVDHVTKARLREVLERIDAEGLEVVLHSTHTSKPPDDISVRLIFPLSRPVTAPEYAQLRAAVCAQLSMPVDTSTNDPGRLYYLPSAPAGSKPWKAHAKGKALDVEALLATAPALEAALPNVRPLAAPVEQEPVPIAMDELRQRLLRVNDDPPKAGGRYETSSRTFMRALIKGEPFRKAHHDDDLQRACSIITGAVPDVSIDAAIEIIRPSLTATLIRDGSEGSLSEESARSKLERGKERSAVFHQKREALNSAMRRTLGREKPSEHAEDKPAPDDPEEDPDAWKALLDVVETKNGISIRPVPCNAALILENDPAWRGKIRFNEVSKELEIRDPPVSAPPSDMDTAIMNWLASSEYQLRLKQHEVASQMRLVARRNSYDPLKDYLLGLKWDGTARLGLALETYFGARTVDEEGRDITSFVRAVSEKWFMAAAARGLKPGAKVDNVLVFEGVEGLYKSQALDALAQPWFARAKIVIGDQNSMMVAASHWLAELAELAALSKSDVESQKQFFSTEVDTFRVPYGRTLEKNPRRCLFVGTTNRRDYLQSDTGNRRFWPIYCERRVDLGGLREVRDQLYAEAVHLVTLGGTVGVNDGPYGVHRGGKWWFEQDEATVKTLENETETRRKDDGSLGQIVLDWWLRLLPERRPEMVQTHEVARDALQIDTGRVDHRTLIAVGRALLEIGFTKRKKRVAGTLVRIYQANEELLGMPQIVKTSQKTAERIAAAQPPRSLES